MKRTFQNLKKLRLTKKSSTDRKVIISKSGEEDISKSQEIKTDQKYHYDKTTKNLPDLQQGDIVRMKT